MCSGFAECVGARANALANLTPQAHAAVTGHTFFPHLIAGPFANGLDTAFTFAIVACLVAAAASLMRGGRYEHSEVRSEEGSPARPITTLEEQHAR